MPQHKWLILTALTLEARGIAKAFGVELAEPGQPTVLPVPGSAALCIIGIGGRRIGANLFQSKPEAVVLAGLAGGLDPSLKIGDIVVSSSEGSWGEGPWPELPYRRGKICTSERIVDSAAAKAELFRQSGALAVDMESDVVGRLASEAGLPLLTIRSISDTAEDAVSGKFMNWIDDFGNPRPAALAAGLAANPTLVPQLMRLGQRSGQAVQSLAEAMRQMLGDITGSTATS